MKRYNLMKGKQKDLIFYTFVADPREIVKSIEIPNPDDVQDVQRPWKEKKVREISKYVSGNYKISEKDAPGYAKGYMPNSIILTLNGDLRIHEEGDACYVDLPDTGDELNRYRGNLMVLDGQHRLISFHESYIDDDLKESTCYQMNFILLRGLSMDAKREVFMILNDKQEKVEANVLRQIRKWLGLLSEEDDHIFEILEKMSVDPISPLRGRIKVGGESIRHGLKLTQITKILKQTKTFTQISPYPKDKQFKVLCNYLRAWDNVYNGTFNNPRHTLGKISGFRYVFALFPAFQEIIEKKFKKLSEEDLIEEVEIFKNVICPTDKFDDDEFKYYFRGETATYAIAKEHSNQLKEMILNSGEIHDPTEGI